jgi:hypothetical protein
MAHAHDHHHHDSTNYYIEQLFTIAACGALGAVAVLLWYNGRLNLILHPKFHSWVLGGGISLLILSGIRAIALWYEVDKADVHAHGCCGHDHDHVHDHDHHHDEACCGHDDSHEHAHAQAIQAPPVPATAVASLPLAAAAPALVHEHEHDHSHDHDHGWSPWRFIVLLVPVLLYMLDVPSEGIRASGTGDEAWDPTKFAVGSQSEAARGEDYGVSFGQLEEAARNPEQREYYKGKRVHLTGRFFSDDPRFFRLVRYRIQCCAADAVPINVTMMVDPKCKERLDIMRYNGKWVEVAGYVHFLHRVDTGEYHTAVIVRPEAGESPDTQVREIPPPADPYVS